MVSLLLLLPPLCGAGAGGGGSIRRLIYKKQIGKFPYTTLSTMQVVPTLVEGVVKGVIPKPNLTSKLSSQHIPLPHFAGGTNDYTETYQTNYQKASR